MIIINNLKMFARTTISLDKADLEQLQHILKKQGVKSLSHFFKVTVRNFLDSFHKKKQFEQMAKNYRAYEKKRSMDDFREMEGAALFDLMNFNDK